MFNNNLLIKINNIKYYVNSDFNIIQACNFLNIDIPKFCYNENLSIAGNCRMCLVEVKGISKPIASCSIPLVENMEIFTNTYMVKKAREGILEFLLLNHPLDCPICDQGGECDLQDQVLFFGNDRGRFYEDKKAISDKNCGPLIKTIMTRCIYCTRCVRFFDIACYGSLGIINRGRTTEISYYFKKYIKGELTGNVIDLCPVGALTSKPYSFIARPWELLSFKTIDILDVMQSNIRVDLRDFKILRILPEYNNKLNLEYISDLTRFAYDGFQNQRLINPLLKLNEKFIVKSWISILDILKNKINFSKINFFLGNFLDCETLILLKKCYNELNFKISINNLNKYENNTNINNDFRLNYLFNELSYNNLDKYEDIILFNLNLRLENPLLNYKLKLIYKKGVKIYNIGCPKLENNFNNFKINNLNQEFKLFIEGKSFLSNLFLKSVSVLFLINYNFLNNIYIDNRYLNYYFKKYMLINFFILNNNNLDIMLNEFNLINSNYNILDKSYKKEEEVMKDQIMYFINTDYLKIYNFENFFLIYQGHTLNKENFFFNKFNLLLPTVNSFEKNSTYINFFGLIQNANFIIYPPRNARNDWKIILQLFNFKKRKKEIKLIDIRKNFNFFGNVLWFRINFNLFFNNKKRIYLYNSNMNFVNTNFYKINQIAKVSIIFRKCNKEFNIKFTNF